LARGDQVRVDVIGAVKPKVAEALLQRVVPEDGVMWVADVREHGTKVALSSSPCAA
jgi:hypothetical protein